MTVSSMRADDWAVLAADIQRRGRSTVTAADVARMKTPGAIAKLVSGSGDAYRGGGVPAGGGGGRTSAASGGVKKYNIGNIPLPTATSGEAFKPWYQYGGKTAANHLGPNRNKGDFVLDRASTADGAGSKATMYMGKGKDGKDIWREKNFSKMGYDKNGKYQYEGRETRSDKPGRETAFRYNDKTKKVDHFAVGKDGKADYSKALFSREFAKKTHDVTGTNPKTKKTAHLGSMRKTGAEGAKRPEGTTPPPVGKTPTPPPSGKTPSPPPASKAPATPPAGKGPKSPAETPPYKRPLPSGNTRPRPVYASSSPSRDGRPVASAKPNEPPRHSSGGGGTTQA